MKLAQWKTFVFAAGLLALALILTNRPAVDAQDQFVPVDGKAGFGIKVLVIYPKSQSMGSSIAVERATLVEIGKHPFLVGRIVGSGDGNDWSAGQNITIAWDDVSTIIEFEDLATYKRKIVL